jgi:hypothetical protein
MKFLAQNSLHLFLPPQSIGNVVSTTVVCTSGVGSGAATVVSSTTGISAEMVAFVIKNDNYTKVMKFLAQNSLHFFLPPQSIGNVVSITAVCTSGVGSGAATVVSSTTGISAEMVAYVIRNDNYTKRMKLVFQCYLGLALALR